MARTPFAFGTSLTLDTRNAHARPPPLLPPPPLVPRCNACLLSVELFWAGGMSGWNKKEDVRPVASTSLRPSATRKASWALIRRYCRAVRCRIDAVLWAGPERVAKRHARGWVGCPHVRRGRCMIAKGETKDGRERQGAAGATSGTNMLLYYNSTSCGITAFSPELRPNGLAEKEHLLRCRLAFCHVEERPHLLGRGGSRASS